MTYIYDIESLSNFFSVTFLNDTDVQRFVIHKTRNDLPALRSFLKQVTTLVGFNNVGFDWPVLSYALEGHSVSAIYRKSQKIIQEKFVNVPSEIKQIDLFKLLHYDNPARATSLKWVAINMGFENVKDMPFPHTHKVKQSEIQSILEYNENDCKITLALYKLCEKQLNIREQLSKYGDMTNFSDAKMGEHIVLSMLSDKTGTSIGSLKKCRTFRKEVRLSDCILPTINFLTDDFNKVLQKFKTMVIKDTKSKEELVAEHDGVLYYFGLGGIHACRGAGIYQNISSCDVSGYYPRLAVVNGFAPAHFGSAFTEVYKQIAEERALYKKGTAENYGLKIAQNGVFGKTNSEYSPFYDPMMFAKITINGQLLLAMLCERITTSECGRVILANTDGIEVEVTNRERFEWLCKYWQSKFSLNLEHNMYKKIVVRDINNYLALDTRGDIKQKGVFETLWDSDDRALVLHKNHSQSIVPLALERFYLEDIPVEKTIQDCEDIKLFLMGGRSKKGRFIGPEGELPKHIRYYISTDGFTLTKRLTKGDVGVHVGYKVTLANAFPDKLINLDKKYYIRECHKIINTISGQTALW